MFAVLRAPHIKCARSRFMDSCRKHYLQTRCICYMDVLSPNSIVETKRHYSIGSSLNANGFKRNLLVSHDVKWNYDFYRQFSISSIRFDKEPLKPSSKVEETVQELKKKEEEQKVKTKEVLPVVAKKPLRTRIWDELVHYYHGFRLLFIDVKISSGLVWRVLNGKTLSRREYRLLTRTVGDLFRLLPFSVFIIVPFMEFLLPFFIKFFPGMLPSTFQTATEKEDKTKQRLKVQLEMAKFLQGTLDNMAVQHKERYSSEAKEFVDWFHKIRTSGKITIDYLHKMYQQNHT